jgi:hypothetical protein
VNTSPRLLVPFARLARVFVLFVVALPSTFLVACMASGESGFASGPDDAAPADDSDADASVMDEPPPNDDAPASTTTPLDDDAAVACPTCPIVTGTLDDQDAGAPRDAAPPAPPFDAGDAGLCNRPVAAGDLVIVELMIESTAGTGDHGEWIEVASTLGCALNLNGLSGNCPTGSKVTSFDVVTDTWIPPYGTFVVADSSNPIVNHALPGLVISWSGEPGDVIRNEGATVTLSSSGALVDSVTTPNLKLTPGVSIAFPSDCPAALRAEWSDWQPSNASWFPAFRGTPNAPNDDVHCPSQPDD